MGLEYSAVKIDYPEAFCLGKDYFGFSDLFPIARRGSFVNKMFTPRLSDLPYLVGSRHIVGPDNFVLADCYGSFDDMFFRMGKLKDRDLSEVRNHFEQFYNWARSDRICLIPDFDEIISGLDRDASCYNLVINPKRYVFVQ